MLQSNAKAIKIRNIREQIESFLALKMPIYSDSPGGNQGSFRISTAKTTDLTYNESSRKSGVEMHKKRISPYYDPRIQAIKRFQRSKIPRTACDDRFGKIPENYSNLL